MPYKSQAQAAFMHIHHPDIAARWDAEYGSKPKKKKGKVTKMDQRLDPFGISKAKSGRASASKTTNVARSHQVQEASTSPVTDASLGMYGHSAATAVSFKGARGRQTARRKGAGQLKPVAKNDALSAFGVDHG